MLVDAVTSKRVRSAECQCARFNGGDDNWRMAIPSWRVLSPLKQPLSMPLGQVSCRPVLSTSLRTITCSMDAMRSDAEKMKDPAVLHALAGAVRIVAEIHLTNKLINARKRSGQYLAQLSIRPSLERPPRHHTKSYKHSPHTTRSAAQTNIRAELSGPSLVPFAFR